MDSRRPVGNEGRTVLITGVGSGIGLITARELGRVGARVVLGVRKPGKPGKTGLDEARACDLWQATVALTGAGLGTRVSGFASDATEAGSEQCLGEAVLGAPRPV